ncbi:MAG TPA: glycosyltransferase family 39 protein [Acidimicrobiia bacterium]
MSSSRAARTMAGPLGGIDTAIQDRRDRHARLAIVAIVLAALVLRVARLGHESFWIDELNAVHLARSGGVLHAVRSFGPFEPPLSHLLVAASLKLPFGAETAARLPMALFGAVEVLALYLLARELTKRIAIALLAAGLLAVAPFSVRYSQEARYYTMFSALELLSWWMWLRALRGEKRAWVWYGVLAGLMLLTHPFAAFVIGVQVLVGAAAAWWSRDRERRRATLRGLGISVAIAAVMVLPWLVYGASTWLSRYSGGDRFQLSPLELGGVQLDASLFKRSGEWLLGNAAHVTPLVVTLGALVVLAPFVARGRPRWCAVAIGAYLLAMTVALTVLANQLNTYFAFRRIESFVPGLLLVAAIAVVGLRDRIAPALLSRPMATAVVVALVGIVVGLSLWTTREYYGTEKSDYRALVAAIDGVGRDTFVVMGPIPDNWKPQIKAYLASKHVHHQVSFMLTGQPRRAAPRLDAGVRRVLWLTGASPDVRGLRTRGLNRADKLQIIAGDHSWVLHGQITLPLSASISTPAGQAAFEAQWEANKSTPFLVPPP